MIAGVADAEFADYTAVRRLLRSACPHISPCLWARRAPRRRHPEPVAVTTDILTAHYCLTHRRRVNMLLKLAAIPLRT